MQKLFFYFAFFISFHLYSQDKIVFKDRQDTVFGKIKSITVSNIFYVEKGEHKSDYIRNVVWHSEIKTTTPDPVITSVSVKKDNTVQNQQVNNSPPVTNIQSIDINRLPVTTAMINNVEAYLGFNFKNNESGGGIVISNISSFAKITGVAGGKIYEGLMLDHVYNKFAWSINATRPITSKEDFVHALIEYKQKGGTKLNLYRPPYNNGGYKIDISGLNIKELINLSKLPEPTIVKNSNETNSSQLPDVNAQDNSESLSRGSGDPLKGLNVSTSKEISSGTYYALIIGVDKYSGQWPTLNTAVNDAKAIENTLRQKYKMNYFYTLYDAQATRSAIMKEFEKLVDTLKEDDNVLIYFSGHGEFKQTMNKGYWVPYDAKTNSVSDLISNNDIQTFLASIKSKHTLLISDACFSGDIFRGTTISIPFEESDKYYSKVYNKNSRQAMTSGGIEPVMDGGKDGHSVFAYYLLKTLTENSKTYFDAGQLYDNLKIPVVNNSDQTPLLNPVKNTGDEGGQFIFIKK